MDKKFYYKIQFITLEGEKDPIPTDESLSRLKELGEEGWEVCNKLNANTHRNTSVLLLKKSK